jgi:SAM-dependent methyltransferase
VPPEKLFREYPYLSSFSDTMLRHSYELVKRLISDRHLKTNCLVIEIGSNDGYLLQYYKQEGIPVLGVEPATNIARMAREVRGIDTMAQFFSETLARQLRKKGQQADVIHAHNVLAHVVDLNGVVSGIGVLLKDNGIAVIEVPYVKDLIDHTEFDTIYHEHLCYFSLTALKCLFQRNQLVIVEVERLPIHGGSLRIFIEKMKTTEDTEDFPSVRRLMEEETLEGLNRIEFYQSFADKVENLRHDLTDLLRRLKGQNKRIVAYGASAKGTMLLTHFGIGREILDYVVDRSTVKQGLLTPGTHLPIYAPEKLGEDQPDYVLLLTWNFAEEILEQQAEYYKRG